MPYKYKDHWVYNIGEKGSGVKPEWSVQDFITLRDEALGSGKLFEDSAFPPSDQSLFVSQEAPEGTIWLRPKEIIKDAEFIVDGASRFDVNQGDIGDCWMLSALTSLTRFPELFQNVVPETQSFNSEDYAGIVHFRFWVHGIWVDIVIDDRIPCDPKTRRPLFLRSKNPCEFWSSLLEKAYAKLYGSYEAIIAGSAAEGLTDFTGGVSEYYNLLKERKNPQDFFNFLQPAFHDGALVDCAITSTKAGESKTETGLVANHAYAVTDVKEISFGEEKGQQKRLMMIRVRNPWGKYEWNGAWSDKSPEWNSLSSCQREQLGLVIADDGEFWMTVEDFVNNFTELVVCRLPRDLEKGRYGCITTTRGSWVRSVTAGGCRNYKNSFFKNPQFLFRTNRDPDEGKDTCSILVELTQMFRRGMLADGEKMFKHNICAAILELDPDKNEPKPLDLATLMSKYKRPSTVTTGPYVNRRQVAKWAILKPDREYCIVPSTYFPDKESQFMLRVFSERPVQIQDYDLEVALEQEETMTRETILTKEEMRSYFSEFSGEDEEMDWQELKELCDDKLEGLLKERVSKETCRKMINYADWNKSGTLNVNEFINLWIKLDHWLFTFNGMLPESETALPQDHLSDALRIMFGVHLNRRVLASIIRRYADRESSPFDFDTIFGLGVTLLGAIGLYETIEEIQGERLKMSMSEFVETVLETTI